MVVSPGGAVVSRAFDLIIWYGVRWLCRREEITNEDDEQKPTPRQGGSIESLHLGQFVRRSFQEGGKLRFVRALIVRLFGTNPFLVKEFKDRVIQTLHPCFLGHLDHR